MSSGYPRATCKVLVTGAAGFIGSHVTEALLARGDEVIAVDSLTDAYDPAQKRRNLDELRAHDGADRLEVLEGDILDEDLVRRVVDEAEVIVHLAGMAGVRASIGAPERYVETNVLGTLRLLQATIASPVRAFVFASTSSAYGETDALPFIEDTACHHPLAPYAATKRAAELLGFSQHHNHGLNFCALRFFTVYGPRNRPDMMAYKLLDHVYNGTPLSLYGGGALRRDWTFVDDIVDGVLRAVDQPVGYEVINLGRGEPVLLSDFVREVERVSGKTTALESVPAPATDMPTTYADISKARRLLGYAPSTSVAEGVEALHEWFTRVVLA